MNHLLGNNNIFIRIISLYALGLILFFMSWTIAYYFLPEGLVRNIGQLGRLAGDTAASSLHRKFLQILLLNMLGFTLTFLTPSKTVPRAERSMKKEQWIAMSIALLILAAAAFREAYLIMEQALL